MEQPAEVRMILVAKINILNPRNRDAKKFAQIAANIEAIGMKRPIVVSRIKEPKNGHDYDLVCGQGRLESVIKMGCTEIAAIIVDISREESLLKSLITRYPPRPGAPRWPRPSPPPPPRPC
jgi:ParB family chromosome partitioning protein